MKWDTGEPQLLNIMCSLKCFPFRKMIVIFVKMFVSAEFCVRIINWQSEFASPCIIRKYEFFVSWKFLCRDSLVIGFRLPAGTRIFLFVTTPRKLGGPSSILNRGHRTLCLRVKAFKTQVHRSPSIERQGLQWTAFTSVTYVAFCLVRNTKSPILFVTRVSFWKT
jgi:hypothetical protein